MMNNTMINKQGIIRQISHCLHGRNNQNAIGKVTLRQWPDGGASRLKPSSLRLHNQTYFGTTNITTTRSSSSSTLPVSLVLSWTRGGGGGGERTRLHSSTWTRRPFIDDHGSSSNPRLFLRSTIRPLSAHSSTLLQLSSPSSLTKHPVSLQKQCFHSTLPANNDNNNNNDDESDDQQPSSTTTTTSDPPILTWYDPYTPAWMGPYLRLARVDKPIGTWLLLWPCLWSTAMATASSSSSSSTTSELLVLPDPFYLGTLFAVGSFVMRGSGCTINDLWDQDFDKQVVRTKARPLASGELTSTQAIQFLAFQLAIGLGVLTSLPNMEYCFLWGASSLPLVVVYPLMKRFTNFPQVVLGLTFNWGAWMGWAATYGSMNYAVIAPLYLSGVCWTVVYDTIYANQDKEDDKAIGLKSTALTFGEDELRHKQILHGFAALTFVQWLAAGYMMEDISMIPYTLGMSAAYSHLLWQIQTAELDNPQNLADRFRSNTLVGGIVFASIVAGKVL